MPHRAADLPVRVVSAPLTIKDVNASAARLGFGPRRVYSEAECGSVAAELGVDECDVYGACCDEEDRRAAYDDEGPTYDDGDEPDYGGASEMDEWASFDADC